MNKLSLHLSPGQALLSAVGLLQFLKEILNMKSQKYYQQYHWKSEVRELRTSGRAVSCG